MEELTLHGQAILKFEDIKGTWVDLPDYVYTDEYEKALFGWLQKHMELGREDVEFLICMALHHETGNRLPYFEFDRQT